MKRTAIRRQPRRGSQTCDGGAPQMICGPPTKQKKGGRRGLSLVRDWRKRLDALCREVVMLRDKCCQWCGRTSNLQWCHIRSRRYLSTRWSLNNTLALCSGCHLLWHHEPLRAVEWFKDKFPERYLAIRVAGIGKSDPHGTWIWLTQEKKRLEEVADKRFGS